MQCHKDNLSVLPLSGNNQQELMLGGENEPDPPGARTGKEQLISGNMVEEVELLTNQEQ